MRGNSVSISGNLTRDVEMRTTQSGRNVASFGLAWNNRRKNAQTGDYEDVPHYFDCECWFSDAQARVVAPKLVKGAHCAVVDGHLAYHSWQAQDGSKRSAVRIVVDDPVNGLVVEQRQTQPRQQQQPAPQAYARPAQAPQYQAPAVYDDSIPF